MPLTPLRLRFSSVLRSFLVALLVVAQLLWPPIASAQLPGMSGGDEMTAASERQLGDSIARELYRDNSYIDDPVLYEYVNEIWQKLLAAARTRGELTPELDERFAWQIALMRDSEINAFALPGGYMGINLGLIAVVSSRDELATVMGHELSHITQRHISRMLARQSRQAPLMLAAMVLGAIAAAKSKSGDAGQALIVGTQAYAMNSQLSFSRDMEREADRVGFGVMTQAGYAPQGAATMFEKLQYASRLTDNGSYPYLRSHPLTSERIADMQSRFQLSHGQAEALPLKMDHAMISARARVLSRSAVDQLRSWTEAVNGSEFTQASPAAQAGMLYAAALARMQMRDMAQSRALAARLVQLTASDESAARLARLLSAQIELAAGAPMRALPFIDASANRRPELFLRTQVAVAMRQGAKGAAPLEQSMRDWVAAHPRDAGAWRMVSQLYDSGGDTLRAVRADAEANAAQFDYAAARDRFKAAQDLVRNLKQGDVDYYEASIIDTRAREIDALWRQQVRDEREQPR